MHIEIHIFPNIFPIDSKSWERDMTELGQRVNQVILDGTINKKAYAIGKTTLLHLDDSGIVVATIDIRKE